VRDHNEDFYAILEPEEVFVLADGMGGHNSGEVASRMAVQHVVRFLTETCRRDDFEFAPEVPASDDPYERLVHAAILHANERIYIESMKDRKLEGMGTTLLVAVGAGERLVFAHVGDSRIYRFRGGELTPITEDHSWFNHMIRSGRMTPEQARTAKGKNVIMRAVGLKGSVVPDLRSEPRVAGDLYLFCSDGLSDLVEDWIIADTLRAESGDLYAACRALVRLALEYGGRDNVTVLLVRVEALEGALADATDEPGGIFDVDTDKIAISAVASAPGQTAQVPRPAALDDQDRAMIDHARARRAVAREGTFKMADDQTGDMRRQIEEERRRRGGQG